MNLRDIDAWLKSTETKKDREYEEAIKESENLEDIEELDEEEDL